MNYVIAPIGSDILHYAKGSESKNHKYISRVLNKGKWVYTYTKNRLRGNKVTNKNSEYQYSPTVKTESFRNLNDKRETRLTEPGFTKQYLYDTKSVQGYNNYTGYGTYSPIRLSRNWLESYRKISEMPITNASVYKDVFDSYTGEITGDNQYSPNDKKPKGTNYTPSQSTKSASSRHYTPNEKQFGNYKSISGSSLSEGVDYDKLEKEVNGTLDKQDKNSYKTKTVTKKKKR